MVRYLGGKLSEEIKVKMIPNAQMAQVFTIVLCAAYRFLSVKWPKNRVTLSFCRL